MTTPHIAALLRERDGYIRRGLAGRAAEVTAVLQQLGVNTKPDAAVDVPETVAVDSPPERTIPPRPKPRRSNDAEER